MTTEASPAPATTALATPPGNPSPLQEQAATSQGDGLSQEQFREMVQTGIDRGVIDRTRAEAEMKNAGNALPLTFPGDKPADASLADAGNPENLPGFAPGRSADFGMPNMDEIAAITDAAKDGTPGKPLTPAETVAIKNTVGAWLETARFSPEIGSAVAKIAGEHVKALPNFLSRPESERQAFRLTEQGRLQALWGDRYAENLGYAHRVANELAERHSDFLTFIGRTGLGDSSKFIMQMAAHGRRLVARAG